MADTSGVLSELESRRGRPQRTPPPRRQVPGEPRPASATVAEPVAPTTPSGRFTSTQPAPPEAAPAVAAATAVAAAAPRDLREPAPEPERMVNVHARLSLSSHEALDRFVREVPKAGWGQTSKIELIQLLVSELPAEPDEAFGERLREFRRRQALIS